MKKYAFVFLMVLARPVLSQDITAARKMVDTLSSTTLWGRGYTNNGMQKTADLISSAFQDYGLIPMDGKTFKQPFSYPVNTFPGKMTLQINSKPLIAGKEFIVLPESKGQQAQGRFQQKDSATFVNAEQGVVLLLKNKLTWSVAPQQADYTGIEVDKKALSALPESFNLNIENLFVPEFKASNICGMVKGTQNPDSILLITAHYDHLGGMGREVYFPGANDNASGVSFLMNLAKYYAEHPQPYSIAFICFAGEEGGLLGSRYFTEHPLIDLSSIRFMINVDMVGTGEDGITVVNATLRPQEFALLNKVNTAKNYLVRINSRGPAANSDHYFFTQKGVPAFFIYTLGGISAYHDVNDRAATLPLTAYENLFRLFVDFNKELTK